MHYFLFVACFTLGDNIITSKNYQNLNSLNHNAANTFGLPNSFGSTVVTPSPNHPVTAPYMGAMPLAPGPPMTNGGGFRSSPSSYMMGSTDAAQSSVLMTSPPMFNGAGDATANPINPFLTNCGDPSSSIGPVNSPLVDNSCFVSGVNPFNGHNPPNPFQAQQAPKPSMNQMRVQRTASPLNTPWGPTDPAAAASNTNNDDPFSL